MKKLLGLLALVGIVGGAQGATQEKAGGDFKFSYDDSQLTFANAEGWNWNEVSTVWDIGTNQSYSANFLVSYGRINFAKNLSNLVLATAGNSETGSFATDIAVQTTNGQKIRDSYFLARTAGYMEVGADSIVEATETGSGYTGLTGDNAYVYTESNRIETVNIGSLGRAGNFENTAQAYLSCPLGTCTIAELENGLGTSSLSFNSVQEVTATDGGVDPLSYAAYQTSDSSLQVFSYKFLNYTNTAPIPEPETYAMLLAGLSLIGAIARRRKSRQA